MKLRKHTLKDLSPLGSILILMGTNGCSKPAEAPASITHVPAAQSFPISNAVLRNCRFQDPDPVYPAGVAIPPNPILCEGGEIRTVTLITPDPLPQGLILSSPGHRLTGTPSRNGAPSTHQFSLENEAGYATLKIRITVK